MLKSPKSSVGWLARKAVALLVAYAFFATSVWSVALPGEVLAGRSSGDFMSSRALTQSLANNLASPLSDLHRSVSTYSNSSPLLAAPNAVTSLASKVPLAMMQAGGGTASSIGFNFNATAIPAGDTIWFSAVLKLNGSVPNHPVSIAVHNSTIQFTAGSTNYSLNVPSSVVTFSPTTTTSTASFDTANNPQPVWLQNQLNPQPSGNTLLQAFAFPVPAGGLPGGIKNVTWTNDFSSDTSNITLNWQWAAAVYTGCVTTTYNSDDAKPTDDNNASIYKNSDHAGTPEACKTYVAQGATGGGSSNYTGSLSGTASVTPAVASAAPVITSTVNPPPNSNGWNNTNVTVSFSCSDANFAIVTCPAPVTVSSEGANQVIAGTAVDQAGNSATAKTSVTVNLDKTSPTITASATSSSGSGSVLTLPVTITFTCADAGSGVASCPSPIQVTTAGVHQVFNGTATDKAGNSASTSIAVTTENAPLAITASVAPPPVNGWNNTNVTISYQCTGGVPPVSCPQSTTVSAEGAGQIISATATDSASQSTTVTTTVNIDKTPPTVTATTAPAANAAGWNTSDVTITYACSDTPSGVAFCPPVQVVSTEGKAQQITATATDKAGNSTPISTTINLEKTAPNITASVAPTPNAAGWNNADVTVSFTCTASVSDIVNCPAPVSVTTEAAGQQISGTVTDQAGKSNTATVTVNLDKTPPSIGITAPVSASYINNNHLPITVTYSDTGSGIDPTTFHVTIDGLNQTTAFTASATGASGSPAAAFADGVHTITVSISDVAGNPATATSTFTVDTIPPQVTITQPANGFFTDAASLVVSGTVVDASPVTVTVEGATVPVQNGAFTSAGITLGTTATQTIHIVATDAAGNSTPVTLTVNIDRTPPTITGVITPAPNGNGWNNTPVTVTFTCADDGSGVAVCPAPVQVSTEGANQAVTGTATDKAGNSAQATVTVNIDETPPTIVGTPAPPANAAGWNTTDVTITYVCADSLSGVVLCPAPQVVSTQGKGQPITASVSDKAGNTASSTVRLSIEKTAPTITGSVAPPPNAAGWNNTAVTVNFVCTPSASDIVTCQPQATVSTEGKGQVITGTVTDQAGKTASTSVTVSIDKTPPIITIGAPIAGAYTNNNHFPFSISYSDAGSGIDITTFHVAIDGVDQTAQFTVTAGGANGTPVAALADGLHTITASIKDVAGNPATATATFTVNTVPPQITITQPANGLFTNAISLVVSGTVVDASPVTVTVAGTAVPVQNGSFTSAGITLGSSATQVIPVVATDAAGNSTTISLTINIDRNPPTITGSINPPPNANNWNNTGVTVTFTCADAESGVAVCPAPVQVSTEGANQAVTGTATDKAGNSAQATVTVNIDETPPTIVGTPAPPANAAGWNTTDVTITYVCADSLSGVVLCPAPQVVSTQGKGQPITASVSDKAGNTASSTITLNIEKTAPTIIGSAAPSPNAAGWNNTDVTVNFVCTPSASAIVTCQPPATVSTEGKGQTITGTVTDQAGKTATTSVTVNLDKTPPLLSATAAPPANAAGWNNTDVVVSFLCSDSLSGIKFCPPPITVSTEGAAQQVSGQAVDQAGNSSSVTTTLNIDKTPPVVTATAAPSPNGAGWNNTNVTVSFACTDNLSGVASCPQQTVVATEGQNQNISGQATDVAGNTATGSILLSIDKTPPTIVQLSTPDHISRLHGGQVSVTANDNFMISQVVITVNGTTLGTFTSAPYQVDLEVPSGANPGDTLTVTAVATDEAGNTQSASRGVSVAADGVIVGQVLSDATSFPIQGAQVQSLGTTSVSDQSDDHGRYSLQASDSHLFLTVTGPATTTVEREVFVQEGVGTVPVDARLTPLAAAMPVGSAGGTLTAGNISITVPSGVVGNGTSFQLTPLTGQGLPGLLPLGWSPLAAFDLRATSSALNLSAAIAQMPNTISHLVTYNAALHAWTMVTPNLQAVSGTVTVPVPSPGDYALVVADNVTPAIPVPSPGEALTGIDMQLLDPSASSSGSLSPAILPPSGGTSTATLGVQTATAVPSGTVIQANIAETFSLTSGDKVSEENRSEDIVLYTALAPANSAVGAQFAVTPSRKYTNAQLQTGKVHLDILAGREGVRGQPGGSNPLTLSDGVSTLSVPGGALKEDTAISLQSISLEDFVPTTGSQSPIQEVLVDFSGDTLNTAAQLSISAAGLNSADTFLLTMVERIDGVPHMVMVALAQINGSNLTSVALPGLPGVVQGGEYVFYDIPAPMGFVQGTVSSSAGPVQSLVQTDSLQIVSITGADGRYIVPALAGSANLKASAPHTNLLGSASVQVTAGQTAQANITLSGAVTSAVVSPADGSLGVPASTTITITTTAPLNPQSIVQSNLLLLKGTATSGTPVALQPFVLSSSGTVLSFAPVSNLQPATQYTIQVSGLADTFGGAVVVPASSFTTKAVAPLNFDPNAITFSFPDSNGNIHVSAPAGSLPAGTQVLIIDQNSGLVLSLTALNDGSVSGSFAGTIDDVLQISVKDPNGATASFTRSQFVAPDGSVAVGPGGGTVTGPGGVALLIPEGALDKAASFKIEAFGPDLFPERPNVPGGTFGGGLKLTSPDKPTFKKEAKLAFPMPPDAPPGAFFQVFGRLHTQDNSQVAFEDIDFALPQGQGSTAQVVTASFPYRGLIGFNELIAQADYQGQVLDINPAFGAPPLFEIGLQEIAFLIWTADNALPGISLGGSITGRVRYPVPPGGTLPDGTINKTGAPVFVGVANAFVTVDSNPPSHAVPAGASGAFTQPDGTFTFSDPLYNGGSVKVIAYDGNGGAVSTTASEVVAVTDKTIDEFAGPLLKYYRNVAFADMVVPAPVPPPPPPQIGISLFTENPDSTPRPGLRVPVNGILATGTNYVLAFKLGGQVQQQDFGVTINGAQESTQKDQPIFNDPTDPNNKDPNTLDLELTQYFNPGAAGIYTIKATGLTAFNQPITVSKTVMAVAAGGNNNTINVGATPVIVSVTPDAGATNVPVDTFVQVLFSEPVTNLAGHVTLLPGDGSTPPPIKLSGFSYLDTTNSNPIANLSATDAVSAVTIQPTTGLKFGTKYTLQITSDVVDLDNVSDPTKPALPLTQPQTPYTFTTFGPQVLGGTPAFSSTRAAVMGDRAYVGKFLNVALAEVDIFNISDPTNPTQTGGTAVFGGRAQDVAGEEKASVIGGDNLLAVASNQGGTEIGFPANLWLFDVTGDQFKRVGLVSVTSSVVNEGQIFRVVLKDNFAYNLVFPIGVRAVDLQQGITDYNNVFPTNPVQFGQEASTDGEGFARDAVVNTVPLKIVDRDQNGTPLLDAQGNIIMITPMLSDLKAGNYPGAPLTDGQTAVVVVGHIPFIVVDPFAGVLYPQMVNTSGQPELDQSPLKDSKGQSLLTGGAVALGQLTDSQLDASANVVQKQVAIVVGSGKAIDPANPGQFVTGPVLAVVDLTTLNQPAILGMVPLDTFPTDVVLFGTTALVGTGANKVLLVNLEDPRNPLNAGSITNSIFGDRLAITADGVLIGTSFNGTTGGLQVASLGVIPRIAVDTSGLLATSDGKTSQDIPVNYSISGDLTQVASAQIQIKDDTGQVVFSTSVPVKASGSVTWPAGQPIHVTPNAISFQVQNPDGSSGMFAEGSPEYTTGSAPTPVILSATPSRIIISSPQQVIDITGRNYLSSTQAQIIASNADPDASATVLPIQFVSSTEVKIQLAPSYFTQPSSWSLSLTNGVSQSKPFILTIIPPNLPDSPTLTSINPAQLNSSADPQDTSITLTGTNFIAGDTLVRADFEDPQSPPELTVQVLSSTQMQVLIPAIWQAAPLQTTLHAESSRDSFLRSADLEFDILNTQNVQSSSLEPNNLNPLNSLIVSNLPNITVVGDGYVPLAVSSDAPSTKVSLQGSNFQSGASVVVDVDGLQTQLAASSASANEVDVEIPPSVFGVKTYTFALLLQVQNANPAHAQPQAHQQAVAHQVYFGNQARYTGPPGGPKNLYNLGGFHRRNTNINAANHPRDYFLMVPSAGFNDAVAYTPANLLQPAGANISFDPDHPVAVPNPPTTQHRVQPLRVTGSLQQADGPVDPPAMLNANKTVGAAKTLVGTLKLQEMRARNVDVHLYFVTEVPQNAAAAAQNPCTQLPLAPKRLQTAQADQAGFVNRLQQGLNDIWAQQANVHFNVTIAQGPAGTCQGAVTPWPVHYDLNNDHLLRQDPSNPNDPPGNPEIAAVIAALPVPNPLPQGVDRAMNVYFVKHFLPSLTINTIPPVTAFNNIPYAGLFGAVGGTPPYHWAIQGVLPQGLAAHQNADGTFSIAGNPAQLGNFPLVVQVTDSENPAQQESVNFPLTVLAPPQNPPANVGNQLAPAPNVVTAGFVTDIGQSTIFLDDGGTPAKIIVHVLAHEIGHALGLNHMSESESQNPNLPTDCTLIPGLHRADSDFSDKSALMWWFIYDGPGQGFSGIQSHIGVRNWIQLLSFQPNQAPNNQCNQ